MQLTPKFGLAVAAGLIFFGAALATYHYTKAAYRAVGFNDGTIDTNTRTLQRFTEIAGAIPVCTKEQRRAGKEFVSVKAEAIYAIAKGPNMISLCRAS
ncbi:hypothetical protein [Massilia sp. TWR1-2-2]|uniref:hypothetical protein n=1 Tax=Massilia sp. TWR1-2-2 TaxID=2804584 RepID=UPI003CE94B25